MIETNTTQSTSKAQKNFLAWFDEQKRKGLKDLKFFPGDVSQATIDLFVAESQAIDQAIEDKRCSPLPNTI